MPEKKTIEKARKAKREGKAPTTQAGEFVREEIDKIRRGEHGARSKFAPGDRECCGWAAAITRPKARRGAPQRMACMSDFVEYKRTNRVATALHP